VQYGAIPVYISDGNALDRASFLVPYDTIMFPLCHELDMPALDHQIKVLFNYKSGLETIKSNAHLFTYEGCKTQILAELKRS
jgi:hypothetical protein